MSTPERTAGRETQRESADVRPGEESEREVRRVEEEVAAVGPECVRESMEQGEGVWNRGVRNGKRYVSAQVEGRWYRVYESGRVLQSDQGRYARVPPSGYAALPDLVRRKVEQAQAQGWRRGERGGVRYLSKRVGGRWYRVYEDSRVFRQEGRVFKRVVPSQFRMLPAAVRGKIELLESRWQRGEENGVRYTQILLGGRTWRINERGQVLMREEGLEFTYVPAGESLPASVRGKLRSVEEYVRKQRVDRLSRLGGEALDRELDREAAERTLHELRSVRVEFGGRSVEVQEWPPDGESFFRLLARLSVRPDRYDELVQNVSRCAKFMGKTIEEKYGPQWKGEMVWNFALSRLESEAPEGAAWEGERIVALSTGALRQPAGQERVDSQVRGNEVFWTFRSANRPNPVRVTLRRDVRASARYAVYEYDFSEGDTTDYLSPDGSIRYRKSPGAVQTFDDSSSTRPSGIAVLRDGATVRYTETADPASQVVTRRFNRGNYVLDRLGGEPVGNFRDFRSGVESGRIRIDTGKDVREAYADHIARNLHTPEAIAHFISRFVSLGVQLERGEEIVRWESDSWGVDVQHPLVTLERGEGDCEDFALLFQYLLRKAGIHSMAVRLANNHFGCVHFEERYRERNGRMEKRYDVVILDNVHGYMHSGSHMPEGFASPEEALRRVVKADMGSFARKYQKQYGHLEGRDPSSLSEQEKERVQYLREMQEVERTGGGVEVLRPPRTVLPLGDWRRTQGYSGYIGYRSDFSRYVRRDADSREDMRRKIRLAQRRSDRARVV